MTKKRVEIDSFDGELRCPDCGEVNLHQDRVEVWNRPEDADEGTHVVVVNDSVGVDPDMSKNPSRRRQGLSIEFFCEHCSCNEKGNLDDKRYVLDIVQHKGTTYVSWKDLDDPNR